MYSLCHWLTMGCWAQVERKPEEEVEPEEGVRERCFYM